MPKKRIWLAVTCIQPWLTCFAASPGAVCNQLRAASGLACASSVSALEEQRKNAGDGYIVEIVAAFRASELQPGNKVLARGLWSGFRATRTRNSSF